jgi:hypothetical protein
VSGAEVEVRGSRQADGGLSAREFLVRAVDGRPAVDGRLEASGGALFVVTADGQRVPLGDPPSALRERVGTRVWVTREADGSVINFGDLAAR